MLMDLEALALAVDDQLRLPAAERGSGRLYAVRLVDGGDGPFAGDGTTAGDPRGARGGPIAGDDTTAGDRRTAGGGPSVDEENNENSSDPACCRLVVVTDDDDDDPEGGGSTGAVVLQLMAEGEARAIPRTVRPPAGVRAIALATGVWAAPLEDDGPTPSRHPERRRAHLTVVVGSEGGRDAVDVSVLRYGDGRPTVLRGGIGVVHQRLLRCWSRRPDAPWAARRTDRAA
jgi:hypothetical protein